MLRIVCLIVVIAKGTLLFTVFAGPSTEAITTLTFERCRGYYDVSGHFDPPFECNMSAYRLCCGTCFYRFCCMFEVERLDQVSCNNYESPKWASDTLSTSSSISDSLEDEILTPPGITAYIVCGVVGVVVILGGLIARCGVLRSSHGDDVQDAAGRDGTAGALSHLLHNQPIAVVQMRNEGLHPSTPRCTARKAHDDYIIAENSQSPQSYPGSFEASFDLQPTSITGPAFYPGWRSYEMPHDVMFNHLNRPRMDEDLILRGPIWPDYSVQTTNCPPQDNFPKPREIYTRPDLPSYMNASSSRFDVQGRVRDYHMHGAPPLAEYSYKMYGPCAKDLLGEKENVNVNERRVSWQNAEQQSLSDCNIENEEFEIDEALKKLCDMEGYNNIGFKLQSDRVVNQIPGTPTVCHQKNDNFTAEKNRKDSFYKDFQNQPRHNWPSRKPNLQRQLTEDLGGQSHYGVHLKANMNLGKNKGLFGSTPALISSPSDHRVPSPQRGDPFVLGHGGMAGLSGNMSPITQKEKVPKKDSGHVQAFDGRFRDYDISVNQDTSYPNDITGERLQSSGQSKLRRESRWDKGSLILEGQSMVKGLMKIPQGQLERRSPSGSVRSEIQDQRRERMQAWLNNFVSVESSESTEINETNSMQLMEDAGDDVRMGFGKRTVTPDVLQCQTPRKSSHRSASRHMPLHGSLEELAHRKSDVGLSRGRIKRAPTIADVGCTVSPSRISSMVDSKNLGHNRERIVTVERSLGGLRSPKLSAPTFMRKGTSLTSVINGVPGNAMERNEMSRGFGYGIGDREDDGGDFGRMKRRSFSGRSRLRETPKAAMVARHDSNHGSTPYYRKGQILFDVMNDPSNRKRSHNTLAQSSLKGRTSSFDKRNAYALHRPVTVEYGRGVAHARYRDERRGAMCRTESAEITV